MEFIYIYYLDLCYFFYFVFTFTLLNKIKTVSQIGKGVFKKGVFVS